MLSFLLYRLGLMMIGRSSPGPVAAGPGPASPPPVARSGRLGSPVAGGWPTEPLPPGPPAPADPAAWPERYRVGGPGSPDGLRPGRGGPGRGRLRRRVIWSAVLLAAALIFRRSIAATVMLALSAALHLVGINAHLPSIRFAWPWQGIGAGTTTNTELGPWVLQKIEGISRPALGQANFNFMFTRKVSKSIGIWPCWYASTFYAVGHASATVDLNPGPAWWAPATGHYRLQVLSRPQGSTPGRVNVTMMLPAPQLPRSVHDVTIDNLPSRPVSVQHSWTYPGFGCGVLLRPQFAQSVLYGQAQQIAFYKASHVAQVTRPLIASAEAQATRTIRDNFIQPTLNAFGYTLGQFAIRWGAR
jgi:hypothetical protein